MKILFFSQLKIQIAFLLMTFCLLTIYADEVIPEWKLSLQSLSITERSALETYFRIMLEDSEGGFVLLGSKPACVEGIMYHSISTLNSIGGKRHEKSVNLWEGSLVWQRYFASLHSPHLIISHKDHPDQLYSQWRHLIWINPKKLQEVVKKNLILFQYVLGPDVTEAALMKYLQDNSKNILSDYTLIGIILGFGVQNSLHYRRIEHISRSLNSRELPPLRTRHERLHISDPFKGQYMGFDLDTSSETNPAFHYLTLSQEYNALCSKRSSSRELGCKNNPLFAVFNRDDEETDQILKAYETDSSRIQTLLKSDPFLENVLQVIFE